MESCLSDMSSECLVTDLVNELSSGLEIPFLLRDDVSLSNKQENNLYVDSIKEECFEEKFISKFNDFATDYIKGEIDYDLNDYLLKNESSFHCNNFSGLSSNSSYGSGSECSSTEIWTIKNELDTPPVTPPDERVSSEPVLILPSDKLKLISLSFNGNTPKCASRKVSVPSSISRKVKIQPKPDSTALNIYESQPTVPSAVMCNVVSDFNSNSILSNNNMKVDSNMYLSSNCGRNKSVLSKKDLEVIQAKRKQERMIRNRESAYLSRKRKKEHVAHLEKQVQELLTENNHLRLENRSLRERLSKYEDEDIFCGKKYRNLFTHSPRKATALLALTLTFCLNFGSFSSFLNEINHNGGNEAETSKVNPLFSSEIRHTRSLLWTNPEFESLNSTFINVTKTSCPLYINQSESIRLESELRRWIGGDDDYSKPFMQNISKINPYFYPGDNPVSQKSNRRKNNRIRKPKRTNNLEVEMYKVKPTLFNFDTFFEAINRRDDTFYLVSFSGDHLLLPALSHNKTSRPKMSLMLPAVLSNDTDSSSDQVELMQIDCEVTNTQLLSVNENDIPSHMRRYSNSTTRTKSSKKKSEKFDELFMNDIERNLVSVHKVDIENRRSSNPLSPLTTENELFFNNSKGMQYEPLTNISLSARESFPKKFTESSFDSKNFETLFLNHSLKTNGEDVVSKSGKNLLKLLMVGQNGNYVKRIIPNSTSVEKRNYEKKFLHHSKFH